MHKDAILTLLRAHEADLRALGVTGLSLFGSVARGEGGTASDIDVAITVDPARLPNGFAYFGVIDDVGRQLEHLLGRPVDIVPEPIIRPALRQAVDRDRAVAF